MAKVDNNTLALTYYFIGVVALTPTLFQTLFPDTLKNIHSTYQTESYVYNGIIYFYNLCV